MGVQNITGQMDYMEALTAAAGAQVAVMFVQAPPYYNLMAAGAIAVGSGAAIMIATQLGAGSDMYTQQVDLSDAAYASILVGLGVFFGGDVVLPYLPNQVDWLLPALMGFAGALVAQKFPKIPLISDLFKKD